MATNVGNVIVDTTKLDKIISEMPSGSTEILLKYGMAIAGEAAINAPVDTSALRNSILSESYLMDDTTFRIQDGVGYGVFQELGTSKMAAQPFLTPALEVWRDRFLKAFGDLFK